MLTLLLTAVLAAAPTAVIKDDGAVEGTVTVSESPSAMMEHLGDPTWVSKIDNGDTEIEILARTEDCVTAAYASPHPILTARYTVKRCRKADGYEATLVESNTFKDYRTRWTVSPDGEGARLHYRLELNPKVLIPAWIARKASRSAIQELMDKLAARYPVKASE